MTGYELTMLALISLPFAVIGFVGGMLFMRWQYIERMRRDHNMIRRLMRQAVRQ